MNKVWFGWYQQYGVQIECDEELCELRDLHHRRGPEAKWKNTRRKTQVTSKRERKSTNAELKEAIRDHRGELDAESPNGKGRTEESLLVDVAQV
ncbi:hypothetical protein PsorP6_017237 [Peronosclerospora sorghi]|uniref:Uncharacterized protein n=1 Tax=Peronosclerospora sorghi TaxID=230839 RepID=A0ACC0WMM8_9STRA|nr:hypothetical protein PsorP6_017237 [Peronosclerospora sorghi]